MFLEYMFLEIRIRIYVFGNLLNTPEFYRTMHQRSANLIMIVRLNAMFHRYLLETKYA